MEEISRELEREIARSKPKPYQQKRTIRVLIVDDFGEMRSGDYLKTIVKIMSILSVICFMAAAVYYFLYTGVHENAALNENRLALAEKKVEGLIREKEILMARIIILGKARVIEKDIIKSKLNITDELPEIPLETEPSTTTNKTVSVENLAVTRAGSNGNLLVRFDIRNISKEPGDVSGRIFTVLKPDKPSEDQWLIVPAAALKDGIPSEYKKGQYFSIAHFKPIKFKIKSQADPDFFKTASIFIFNEQAQLIFEELINITGAK